MRRNRWFGHGRAGPVAMIGVGLLTAALGASAASGEQKTTEDGERSAYETPELLYQCETESGRQDMRVRVGLSLPESGSVSTPIKPTEVTVDMTLPEPVVGDVAENGVSEVVGRTMLAVRVRDSGESAESESRVVQFSDLAVPVTPLPQNAPLTLTATGEAPAITPAAAGEMAVSADRLTLLLTSEPPGSAPGSGDGGTDGDTGGAGEDDGSGDDNEPGGRSTAPETGTSPGNGNVSAGGGGAASAVAADRPATGPARAMLTPACTPAPDQDTTIGTVPIAGDAEGPSGDSEASSGDGTSESGDPSGRPAPLDNVAQQGAVPPECESLKEGWTALCAYIGGYTNVDGLRAATRIEPGITNLSLGNFGLCADGSGDFCQSGLAQVNEDGNLRFPPTRNSFHAFDFMPTEATVELTQLNTMELQIRFNPGNNDDGSVVAHAEMSLRLYDVTVNGVPLDVGDECRTADPLLVKLTANYPGDYSANLGGTLDGYVDIPPFSGCGVGEDLDPLMNGLIEGEGYYVKFTQGAVCSISQETGCPPQAPELKR